MDLGGDGARPPLPHLFADFPGRDGGGKATKDLGRDDYVRHVRGQVDAFPADRLVLVAHSLGGVVAIALAEGLSARLAGFVGVGAAIPRDGGSFVSPLPPAKRVLMTVLMRVAGTMERSNASLRQVPRMYVRLTEDKEFGVPLQDAMARDLRTQDVRDIGSGHLPMLSKPGELAGVFNELARTAQSA